MAEVETVYETWVSGGADWRAGRNYDAFHARNRLTDAAGRELCLEDVLPMLEPSPDGEPPPLALTQVGPTRPGPMHFAAVPAADVAGMSAGDMLAGLKGWVRVFGPAGGEGDAND